MRVPRTVPWWLWFPLHPFAVQTLVWSSAERNRNLCTSVTFLALKSACKVVEPYYSILEKEFSSCLSKCAINPQKRRSSTTEHKINQAFLVTTKQILFVQRLSKDRWSTRTLFLVTKFFNERGKFWNGKTKQMQINRGIIIPASDIKVTVDKSIAYFEVRRTKLFAKKAQRSRGKV